MPLPANYHFSPFVLKSKQAKPKPKYESTHDANGMKGWDANEYMKVKRDYALGNKTFATETYKYVTVRCLAHAPRLNHLGE